MSGSPHCAEVSLTNWRVPSMPMPVLAWAVWVARWRNMCPRTVESLPPENSSTMPARRCPEAATYSAMALSSNLSDSRISMASRSTRSLERLVMSPPPRWRRGRSLLHFPFRWGGVAYPHPSPC